MIKLSRQHMADLRGVTQLAIDVTTGVTAIAENVHKTTQSRPCQAAPENTSGITGIVYKSIKGTTKIIGKALTSAIVSIESLLAHESTSSKKRAAFVSVVNGAFGDYLVASKNPLALPMSVYFAKQRVLPTSPADALMNDPLNNISSKIMIFVHGLCLNNNYWQIKGENPSEVLALELGYTPLYLSYNTGKAIYLNGNELAETLEQLMHNWPVAVSDITLIGHSMGGLVARSAALCGSIENHLWRKKLNNLIFMGTPHCGAPLEKGAKFLDRLLATSPYAAPFTKINKARSQGIINLGYGCITATPKQFVQLPNDVKCFTLAVILNKKRHLINEYLTGDGLVPLNSALGQSNDPTTSLNFPKENQWIGFEIGHNEMLCHADIYKQIRHWL